LHKLLYARMFPRTLDTKPVFAKADEGWPLPSLLVWFVAQEWTYCLLGHSWWMPWVANGAHMQTGRRQSKKQDLKWFEMMWNQTTTHELQVFRFVAMYCNIWYIYMCCNLLQVFAIVICSSRLNSATLCAPLFIVSGRGWVDCSQAAIPITAGDETDVEQKLISYIILHYLTLLQFISIYHMLHMYITW
jgi:hypothetical protein